MRRGIIRVPQLNIENALGASNKNGGLSVLDAIAVSNLTLSPSGSGSAYTGISLSVSTG